LIIENTYIGKQVHPSKYKSIYLLFLKNSMKKRQLALVALLAWQAITTYSKDEEARDDLIKTPGLVGKIKKIGQKLRETNKATIEDLKKTDWESTAATLKEDANHDAAQAKEWIAQQENTDRAEKWHQTVRTIIEKTPDQKALAETAEKYTTRIKDWWNSL
jgi:hypothetical protein